MFMPSRCLWRNRWLVALIVLAAVGAVVCAVARSITPARRIRARAFVLVDEQGEACALLGTDRWGPRLVLVGSSGHASISMRADQFGSVLSLENAKQQTCVRLDSKPTLTLETPGNWPGVRLTLAKTGEGVELHGPDGKMIWSAPQIASE